ncbi:MAG TPA: phosphopantetheine-binding protein [Burkholderiales bacterium]|nr:phosphopantetheine-binding protein [Burkholderiales bacterium]
MRRFILSAAGLPSLADDDDLFDSGIVNSLFAVQLMTFIEKEFSIEVGTEDLDIRNFRSLNATAAFILNKSALQPA